jgi:hypothetical protein
MTGDVDAAAHPNSIVTGDMVKESLKTNHSPGASE